MLLALKISDIPDQMAPLGYRAESCSLSADCATFGDDFMIERAGDIFRVCDLDRNIITNICLETENEAEACEYFLKAIAGRSRHLVTSKDSREIERLQAKLEERGLTIWRNDILTLPGPEFPQYRIFASAADYLAAKDILTKS